MVPLFERLLMRQATGAPGMLQAALRKFFSRTTERKKSDPKKGDGIYG